MNNAPDHDGNGVPATARATHVLLSLFAIVVCALALGAVTGLIALFSGLRACWPMLLGAPLLTWILRGTGSLRLPLAPLFAAAAVLLAGAYAECLDAIARISAVTGASFSEAWHLGGAAFMLQVAELALSPLSVLIYAAEAILAAWLARPRNNRPAG
ncbi:MAG TPA: hypothetical protein VJ722_02620 [Rhodanobacteraceae bacterium]|nr:hypothetical protein [Rhodanobacteraceae bacterium]